MPGALALIVRRPDVNAREGLDVGEFSIGDGLVGDNWKARGSSRTAGGHAHPDMQLNIMSSRMIEVLRRSRRAGRWPAISCSSIWISVRRTCRRDAADNGRRGDRGHARAAHRLRQVRRAVRRRRDEVRQLQLGQPLRLRGVNARVVQAGRIRKGDVVKKTAGPS